MIILMTGATGGDSRGMSETDETSLTPGKHPPIEDVMLTFEFQARTIYEARGYKVAVEVKDYPPGSSY
ncbi:hypothetical protein [Psychrobacillus sp. L3]|uniref:hypothetical protein n=1 Tax=Psychrobacillus sp. L3 TaxID=3236891 RepID=UPI0036F3F173